MSGVSPQALLFRLLPVVLGLVIAAVLAVGWFDAPWGSRQKLVTYRYDGLNQRLKVVEAGNASDEQPAPDKKEGGTLAASAAELAKQYRAEQDISARIGILHDLADDAQSGRAAYIDLMKTEDDELMKTLMVNLAEAAGEPDDDLFTLLGLALEKAEPTDVRLAAQRVLAMTADARAIPLWKNLLSDEDPAMREIAADQIALLREAEAPVANPE